MATRPVYLDNLATTPVDGRVLDVMLPYFRESFGNAASVTHRLGQEAAAAVAAAREQVAAAIGALPDEIVFTSGGTEANNLALKGAMRAAVQGKHLIVSAAEHKAVLDPAQRLRRDGFDVSVVGVDEFGRLQPDVLAAAIRPDTVLVSAMLVNNEVGSINAVRAIANICREREVLLHCDAVQALGKIRLSTLELGVDLLSLSAHKAYGPKGVGALYVRGGDHRVRLEPLLHGGAQERGLRSGTVPVPIVAGFGEACRLVVAERESDELRIAGLRDELQRLLFAEIGELVLNGHPRERISGNLSVSVPGVDGDLLLSRLAGVCVSAGSACTTRDPEPSHVLRAMGRSSQLARASLRFGVGRFNTADEIARAAECTLQAIRSCRR